jgi:hypothetical protein
MISAMSLWYTGFSLLSWVFNAFVAISIVRAWSAYVIRDRDQLVRKASTIPAYRGGALTTDISV